ncbi:MAG: efflux RND transporter periplasmic adaptor subunit [Bacteroidota bacterium]
MKYFLSLLLALSFVACQPSGNVEDTNWQELSLDEQKAYLRTLQTQNQQLEATIAQLDSTITSNDPSLQEVGALVTTTSVQRKDFSSYVSLQGAVSGDDLYDATAEIAGRITRLTVSEGDNVRKGQLIATLDVATIQSQRAELEKSLELATTVYERQKRLWDQNIGSEIQFLQAENNKERLEKSLESLDITLAKDKVYAPTTGVVERVIAQSGEVTSPGLPIVQILNTSRLKIAADVPENYIRNVNRGDKVQVSIPALGFEQTASVSQIGKTVDPANRTFQVEVRLPSDPALKPNLLAEMKIRDFEAKDVVAIPLNRIQQDVSGKSYVFVRAQEGDKLIARKTFVELGRSYEGEAIIKSGLQGGEELILEGARNVSDGQKIEVINTQNTRK